MQFLKNFVKHPQMFDGTGGEIVNGKIQKISKETAAEAMRLVKEARIFILDEVALNKRPTGKDFDLPLALPFKTCWFEVLPEHREFLAIFIETKDALNRTIKAADVGILVNEISPGSYDFFCLELVNGKMSITIFRNVSSIVDGSDPVPLITLRIWLTALASGQLGVEETDSVLHVPRADRPKKTKPHHIRQIVRITTKGKKKTTTPITPSGVVSWSHRWEVRGFWRRVKTIGKDRNGDYCVRGFTWVSPHVKGPEDSPLVVKTRIVTE